MESQHRRAHSQRLADPKLKTAESGDAIDRGLLGRMLLTLDAKPGAFAYDPGLRMERRYRGFCAARFSTTGLRSADAGTR